MSHPHSRATVTPISGRAVNVGIIGAGFMGGTHARAYTKTQEARVTVVADQQKERAVALTADVGGRADSDPEVVFLDPTVDLVDLAIPTPLHPQYAIRALAAGKHVVVEKPLALTLPEADAIVEAARRAGRFLMVAHVLRFWPEYEAMRALLQTGRLGQPLFATAHRLSNPPQWATWFRDPKASGGAVLDLHIHDLDVLNWIFGPPERVVSRGVKDEAGGWNHVVTLVDYRSVSAAVEASTMMPQEYPFSVGLRILCEKGVIEYRYRAGGASFEIGQETSHLELHEPGRPNQPVETETGDAFEREIAYFVHCVKTGQRPTIVTPEDALWAVRVALAARESLETGSPINITG